MSTMNPHVSDEQISNIVDQTDINPNGEVAMERVGMRVRDLYEPIVTSQAERIAALEKVVKAILEEYDDETVLMHTPIAYFKKFDAARALLTPKTTDPK